MVFVFSIGEIDDFMTEICQPFSFLWHEYVASFDGWRLYVLWFESEEWLLIRYLVPKQIWDVQQNHMSCR